MSAERIRTLAAALLCLVVLSRAACAAPTGINQIPTADIMPFGYVVLGVQNGNTLVVQHPTFFEEPVPNLQSQFGISRRIEVGLDLQPTNGTSDYRAAANFKWAAVREDYDAPGIGLGVTNIGPGFQPVGYVIFTRTLNFTEAQYHKFRAHHRHIHQHGFRVHAGALVSGAAIYPMVGTDMELGDNFVFSADWISGGPNAASIGGTYVFDDKNSVLVAVQYSNSLHKFNGVIFTYSLQMKL